jgi:hypothetical protein
MARAPARAAGASAWRRVVADVRGWPVWKQALAAIACVVAAVWIVQAPWRPALGLLGLLTLATVVLATNAWELRGRVPLLRSRDAVHVAGGWSLVAGVLLLTGALAVPGHGPTSPARPQASRPASTQAPSPTPAQATPSTVVAAPPPPPTLAPSHTPAPHTIPAIAPTLRPAPTHRHTRHTPPTSPIPSD